MLMKLTVHATKTKADTLVVVSKETGLEVNADKNTYRVTFRDKDPRRSHNAKTDNSPSEMVEMSIYLGTKLTKQNSTQEEFKSSLKSENTCYHSMQGLLFPSLLPKHLKIKIYGNYNFAFFLLFCTGVKLGCSHWGRSAGRGCLRLGC